MSRQFGLVEMGWLSYREQVVPTSASAVQVQESRRAFYAGAAHIFSVLGALGGDEFSEYQGVQTMERVSAELRQYARDVGTSGERRRR